MTKNQQLYKAILDTFLCEIQKAAPNPFMDLVVIKEGGVFLHGYDARQSPTKLYLWMTVPQLRAMDDQIFREMVQAFKEAGQPITVQSNMAARNSYEQVSIRIGGKDVTVHDGEKVTDPERTFLVVGDGCLSLYLLLKAARDLVTSHPDDALEASIVATPNTEKVEITTHKP